MKKAKVTKLELHRETVRALQEPDLLKEVMGGAGGGSNNTCGGSLLAPCKTCQVF